MGPINTNSKIGRSQDSGLELELKKIGIPVSHSKIVAYPNLFDVAKILKKSLKYEGVEMDNIRRSGGTNGQIERILELSTIENITNTIESLAKSGYRLKTEWRGLSHVPCILEEDINIIRSISISLEPYFKALERIKKSMGIRHINYTHDNACDILSLAFLKEEQWTAIDVLCKCGYIGFPDSSSLFESSLIEKLSKSDTDKFLDVFNVLKKRLNYESIFMENLRNSGGLKGQVTKILELSSLEGIDETLGILAESGYELSKEWKGLNKVPCILKTDLDIVKKMVCGKLYKKEYCQLITKLEKRLGYKNIKKDYTQLLYLTDFFSRFRSDICEKAIDLLPLNFRTFHYHDKLTEEDVSEMKKIAYDLWEKELDSLKLENICLYKENAQGFIELFSSLKEREQKAVLKSIMDCAYENKEIIKWLDKNYIGLIREVGLGL